jgi:hypothetical protein
MIPARADGIAAIFTDSFNVGIGERPDEPEVAETLGQTFTIPTLSALESFSFFFTTNDDAPGPRQLKTYVAAWDGMKATGPILFQSPVFLVSSAGYLTFDTADLLLTPGQYVAFASAAGLFDGVNDMAVMRLVIREDGMGGFLDPLPGGDAWYQQSDNDFSRITTQNWLRNGQDPDTVDWDFQACIRPVPEPTSWVLCASGALGLLGRLRRRRDRV